MVDLLEESGEVLLVQGVPRECAERVLALSGPDPHEAPVVMATREALLLLRPLLPRHFCASISLSPFDLLPWLQQRAEPEQPLGVIFLETDDDHLPRLQPWLGVKVIEVLGQALGAPDDRQPTWPELVHCCQQGAPGSLAGGAAAARLARTLDLPFYPIFPSRRSVLQALERAREIRDLREAGSTGSSLLEAVLENAEEGILTVENSGRIRGANRAAQALDAAGPALAGRQLEQALPALSPARRALEQTGACPPFLAHLGQTEVLVKAAALSPSSQQHGAVITFQDVTRISPAPRRRQHQPTGARYRLSNLVGDSPALQAVKDKVPRCAESSLNLLIAGETGTGKEMLAQAVHNAGPRQSRPFLAVNCAALSDSLLESELFGYSRGAFTGALSRGKTGLFLAVDGGTLFLDEVSELPAQSQGRLLRALEEKSVRPLGSETILPVDVRIIASSNRDLWQEVERGNFRRDLFFRLAALQLLLPPLRQRAEDIPALARHLVQKHASPGRQLSLTPDALEALTNHPWPGNVRQMENALLRAVLLAAPDQEAIDREMLTRVLGTEPGDSSAGPAPECPPAGCLALGGTLRQMEAAIIQRTLAEQQGDVAAAARLLELDPRTVRRAAPPRLDQRRHREGEPS